MTRESRLRRLVAELLPDYLTLVEPDSARLFDLEAVRLLEANVPAWSRRERAGAGVIAELPTRRGERLTVFVRIEPEPGSEGARRLARLVLDLLRHHGRPVLASAVFIRGGSPGPNLCTVSIAELAGLELLRLSYTGFGLSAAVAEHYLRCSQPLAWALAAAMRPHTLSRAELRRACLARIEAAELAPGRKALLAGFVRSSLGL
ncbi:MAG: hypothetical protein ACJ76J_01815 [Thermoanaerobaculia bacterium]